MSDSEHGIQKLDPREHVRMRPGMYLGFGGVDIKAMHQLVEEILENAVNQAVEGRCSAIDVILSDEYKVTISDNGPGIPVATFDDSGKRLLEVILTQVGGRSFDGTKFQGGMFGVGLAAVNAVSSELFVEVKRDSYLWQQSFAIGFPKTALEQVRPMKGEGTGTTITFSPDFDIFDPNDFDYERLAMRCRELAYLVAGLSITLTDIRNGSIRKENFLSPNGVEEYVGHINRDYTPAHPPVYVSQPAHFPYTSNLIINRARIDFALQYIEEPDTVVLGYVNAMNTENGSDHDEAILTALHMFLDHHIREQRLSTPEKGPLMRNDVIPGLSAVISIWHPSPKLAGSPGRPRLSNPDVKEPIVTCIYEALGRLLRTDPETIKAIARRCVASKTLREQRLGR